MPDHPDPRALVETARVDHRAATRNSPSGEWPECGTCEIEHPCVTWLLAEALERALPVVNAVASWRDDPIYQHERAIDVAIDAYRAGQGGPAEPVRSADDWPAQQRRIAAKIAKRYEEEAP